MRQVDPFDYWAGHSSALRGLGGSERSPDPRYLFHTRYHEVREGRARFIMTMRDVRASYGELAVRVHAWKPSSHADVSLVSGARVLLDGALDADITLPVHFAAQEGVLYALYGYLSEDSDIDVRALDVAIDEVADAGELRPEPPRSLLVTPRQADGTRPTAGLLHSGSVDTLRPVSQSCTVGQAATFKGSAALTGRNLTTDPESVLTYWTETVSLNALNTYVELGAGSDGLVLGPFSNQHIEQLARSSSIIWLRQAPAPSRDSADFFDFIIMTTRFEEMDTLADMRERWEWVEDWLARLKIGGMAAVGVRYRAENNLISSSAADPSNVSKNEIGQWTLRLIGKGYSVAPLAFAPAAELVIDRQGLAGFVLIIQRS